MQIQAFGRLNCHLIRLNSQRYNTLWKFNCLPFGISSAPELFQKMLEILSECDGVVGLIDDLLIYGKTEKEHHRQLVTVLGKLKREGMTINKEKCKFYDTEIFFLGHIVNEKQSYQIHPGKKLN